MRRSWWMAGTRRTAQCAVLLSIPLATLVAACSDSGPVEVVQTEAQSITVKKGQDVVIRLQGIGGEYQSPPEFNSTIVVR